MQFSLRDPVYVACLLAWVLLLISPQSSIAQEVEAIDCEGEWADSPLCKEREKAIETRARVEALLEELPIVANPPWDSAIYETAMADFEKGQTQYQEQFFGDAASKFEGVVTALLGIKEEFETASSRLFADAFAFLDNEDYAYALSHFEQLATWVPQSNEVADGLHRAETGTQLATLVDRIDELVEGGSIDEADLELSKFPEGYWTKRIADAKGRITQHRHTQSFNSMMSEGLSNLDGGRWLQAKQHFAKALSLSPDSIAAKEALADAESRLAHHNFQLLTEELATLRTLERWESMLPIIVKMNQMDPEDHGSADTGAEIESLLNMDKRLAEALDGVSNTMNKQTRDGIRELLDESSEHIEHARIAEKRTALAKEFERFTTPVSVTLVSDRKTQVSIRPGRKLGTFSKKVISVYPGSYELIGIRKGFREARQSISIEPGSKPIEIRVVCDVRF